MTALFSIGNELFAQLLLGQVSMPGLKSITRYNTREKQTLPETIAFERYAVKTSEKANIIHNRTGLLLPDPLALCNLEAHKSQRRACVDSLMLSSTSVAIIARVRLSASYILAKDPELIW